jgi:hypothetical protein
MRTKPSAVFPAAIAWRLRAAFIALSALPAQAQDKGTDWTLETIRVFNGMGTFAQITSEKYDAKGGAVEVNLDGRNAGICPGGSEKIRFTWSFGKDATNIDAAGISAVLESSQLGTGGGCRSELSGRTNMILRGSAGVGGPFTDAEVVQFDLNRFYTAAGTFISPAATNVPRSGPGRIGVAEQPYYKEYPKAYFMVDIIPPTVGRLRYAYIYKQGRGPTTGGGATTPQPTECAPSNPTFEYGLNRYGNDYREASLAKACPEFCEEACAADNRCAAWTFVKPGGLGPSARCFLKNPAPPTRSDPNTVSGTFERLRREPTPALSIAGLWMLTDDGSLLEIRADGTAVLKKAEWRRKQFGFEDGDVWARDIRSQGASFEGTFVRRMRTDYCGDSEPGTVRGTISATGYKYSNGPEMVVKSPLFDILYAPKCQWTDKEIGENSINLKPVKP